MSVGVALETDTALGGAISKSKATGVAIESDAALGASLFKAKATGLAAENDSAIAPSIAPMPLGVPGTWIVVKREQFAGTDVDGATWKKAGGPFDDGVTVDYGPNPTAWDPANVSVSGGVVTCAVTAGSPPMGGGIFTKGLLNFGYGFIQFEAKCSTGAWPAVWLQSTTSVKEIDAFERTAWNGSGSTTIHALHTSYSPDVQETATATTDSTNWHTIGILWQSGQHFKFYVDGILTWESTFIFSPDAGHYALISNTSYSGSSGDTGTLNVRDLIYWTGTPT